MRVLFAISVLCFCTVLWIALSLARRLRIAQNKERRRIEQGLSTEFFEAGEFRTPRPLRVKQEVVSKDRPATLSEADAIVSSTSPQKLQLVTPWRPAKQAGMQASSAAAPPTSKRIILDENAVPRKSPQPARLSGFRRIDLSQYTEDMGDLTDPYTHPLRASGTHRSASKNG